MATFATQVIDKMTDAIDSTKTLRETDAPKPSGKTRSIKHQFLWCFLTIALVTLGVSIVLLADLAGGPLYSGANFPDHAFAFYAALRWRIALGAALIITAAGGVFQLLNRRIADPLEKTAAAAGRMAEGNLGATIPAGPLNEIGRIGESVNGLAINFQEALILVWNQTENAIDRIRRTTRQMAPDTATCLSSEMLTDLASARQDLETMQMMVRSFDLYDVTISASDVLTAKDKAETLN